MKLYNKEELKDSRIFFDKKPPKFLTIFIVFTLAVLLGSGFVANMLVKPYVVKAQGVITTTDNNYVGSLSDGVVMEVKKEEGSEVKKGDVLFTVSSGVEGVQYKAIAGQLEQSKEKIKAMDKFVKSLNENINHMKNAGIEQEYYGKAEYYLSLINDEYKAKQTAQANIKTKQEKRAAKQAELDSIVQQIAKLTTSEEDIIKKEELESSKQTKVTELETLDTELTDLQQQGGASSQAFQTKLQLISELGASRSSIETSIVDLEGQMASYKTQDALYSVKASNDGYIHYLNPIKNGVTVQKTQTLAEISKNANADMIVEAYINAADISKVKVGNDIKVALNGVNSSKYGTLKGKLKSIDTGTITQETNNGNAVYYRCIIHVNDSDLKASDGEVVKAIKSMPVEAQIVYEKETYMDWILNMLSFKN